MGSGVDVIAVSAYMGGTRGSCVFSSAGDVLEMSVVRGVGGVCDICMCLTRGGVGGVGGEWIGFGLYQSWRNRGKWDMCLCFDCGGVSGVGGGCWLAAWAREGGVLLTPCLLDYLCRWQVQVSVYCARRIPPHLRCT